MGDVSEVSMTYFNDHKHEVKWFGIFKSICWRNKKSKNPGVVFRTICKFSQSAEYAALSVDQSSSPDCAMKLRNLEIMI